MADISARFLQLKAISPMLVGQNWETRIAADSTGLLWASVKGGAYTPLGMGNPDEARLVARSASIMGGVDFGRMFDDLNTQTLTNWTMLGTPVLDATHGFGVWSCVNTNNTLALKTLATVANPSVTPWHFAARMRIATAPGGAEIKAAALRQGLNDFAMVGVLGAVSTTKFVFQVSKTGVPVSALSTISLDTTSFHIGEMWFDGTTVWGSVDNETPVRVAVAANLTTSFFSDAFGVFTAAGGALGIYFDYYYSAAARTAT